MVYYSLDHCGFNTGLGKGFFLFPETSNSAVSFTHSRVQCIQMVVTSETKQPEREADHSPASSAGVKNKWSYTSTPIFLRGVYARTVKSFHKTRQVLHNIFVFNIPLLIPSTKNIFVILFSLNRNFLPRRITPADTNANPIRLMSLVTHRWQ